MLMHRLASFIMTGRPQAVIIAVLLAVAGAMFPPIALFSGAAVGLVTLRLGLDQGLIVLGWASIALVILAGALLGSPAAGLVYAIVQWVPIISVAVVLRRTGSWSIVMTALAVTGVVIVLGVHLWIPNANAMWTGVLHKGLGKLLQQAGMSQSNITAAIAEIARYATGAFMMSLEFSVVLSLMIARVWQALLYNPGGFRQEYTTWRLSHVMAGIVIILVIALFIMHNKIVAEMIMVMLTPFLFQALGLFHGLIRQTGAHVGWLVGLYLLLFLAPAQVGSLLAAIGVIDSFADFRKRFGNNL